MQAMIQFPEISPEIFSVSFAGFEFALRWYALAYIVGILLAWQISRRALETARLWPARGAPMDRLQLEDFLTWAIAGVILGGRLGFVLFYQPDYYLANPQDILKIWQGGMAFHGGMLGVVIAGWIFAARYGLPKLSIADVVVLGVPVGLLLGRIANFINAELWGRPTDLPWGVAFPGFDAQACGQIAGLCARHPSQLYEALLEGAVLLTVMLWLAWRKDALKAPGTITGVFFTGYGTARFLVEFVRQPDPQFVSEGNPLGLALHLGGYGLTMGQILSLPMVLVGLWLIRRAAKVAA
ncbi:prolipoprotein diacylglyceryl transferase [Cognatishimia maritima]|uniref:Phosphatidylglycerol--prolipoprotein diacylglyceryl transferase n=1 Tax=Cognatishimia maritima TaxID=870908 RepID=A0A1M5KYH1_9RHOB|nr:prolipoprotein diacylglyceryl transferase [Cognatishimia maritima]SHG57720.1 Prolipoprotein diacylglyceryl transferase [Cognatishimia maritima]